MILRRSEIRDHRPARFQIPSLSLRERSRPEPSQYPPLGNGYGSQVHASPYGPIVPRYPTLSLRQGVRPEYSQYPPLEHGYRPQVHTFPYDPIVPGNRNPMQSASYEDGDEDEKTTAVRNAKKARRRPQTD